MRISAIPGGVACDAPKIKCRFKYYASSITVGNNGGKAGDSCLNKIDR